MKNPRITMAVDMVSAIGALRLRSSARVRSVSEGVELIQPGKPTLLLTHECSRQFANAQQEADHS